MHTEADILKIIKDDNDKALQEHYNQSNTIPRRINGLSLIIHAINERSPNIFRLILSRKKYINMEKKYTDGHDIVYYILLQNDKKVTKNCFTALISHSSTTAADIDYIFQSIERCNMAISDNIVFRFLEWSLRGRACTEVQRAIASKVREPVNWNAFLQRHIEKLFQHNPCSNHEAAIKVLEIASHYNPMAINFLLTTNTKDASEHNHSSANCAIGLETISTDVLDNLLLKALETQWHTEQKQLEIAQVFKSYTELNIVDLSNGYSRKANITPNMQKRKNYTYIGLCAEFGMNTLFIALQETLNTSVMFSIQDTPDLKETNRNILYSKYCDMLCSTSSDEIVQCVLAQPGIKFNRAFRYSSTSYSASLLSQLLAKQADFSIIDRLLDACRNKAELFPQYTAHGFHHPIGVIFSLILDEPEKESLYIDTLERVLSVTDRPEESVLSIESIRFYNDLLCEMIKLDLSVNSFERVLYNIGLNTNCISSLNYFANYKNLNALMLAADFGSSNLAEYLAKYIFINNRDANDQSALDYALGKKNNETTLKMLLNLGASSYFQGKKSDTFAITIKQKNKNTATFIRYGGLIGVGDCTNTIKIRDVSSCIGTNEPIPFVFSYHGSADKRIFISEIPTILARTQHNPDIQSCISNRILVLGNLILIDTDHSQYPNELREVVIREFSDHNILEALKNTTTLPPEQKHFIFESIDSCTREAQVTMSLFTSSIPHEGSQSTVEQEDMSDEELQTPSVLVSPTSNKRRKIGEQSSSADTTNPNYK